MKSNLLETKISHSRSAPLAPALSPAEAALHRGVAGGHVRLLLTVLFGAPTRGHAPIRRRLAFTPMLCAIALAFASLVGSPARAANITWAAPTRITANSDVINNMGTLFGAANLGNGISAITVNGVTFNPFSTNYTASSFTSGNFMLSAGGFINGGSTFGAPGSPFSALSTPYQRLLQSASYLSSTGPLTLQINGLTVGQAYLVQFWVNDAHEIQSLSSETISSGNSTSLQYTTPGSPDGGTGQFVTGTFTANATSQSISFAGSGSPIAGPETILNAFQIRAVPEPSVWGMMVAGTTLRLAVMRFRVRRS